MFALEGKGLKALEIHSSYQRHFFISFRDLFAGFGNIIEWEREVLTYTFIINLTMLFQEALKGDHLP